MTELDKKEVQAFLNWDAEEDDPSDPEEQQPNTEDFIALHKRYLADMKDMEQGFRLAMEVYDPDRHKRGALEKFVTVYMMSLHHVARQFHPLSTYGKEYLKKAVEAREQYEKRTSPILTRITRENAELFAHLLTRDKREEIETGRRNGLGAIRSRGNETFAAGALTYYLDEDPLGEGVILRIDWLYVDEAWRLRGVAQSLLAEVITLAVEEPSITGFSAEYPADDYGILLNNLLANWNFTFDTGVIPEFICRLGEAKTGGEVEKLAEKTTLFSEIGREDRERLLKHHFRVNAANSRLERQIGEKKEYLDPDVSCFIGDIKAPDGVLLAHKCPSGMIRVEEISLKKGFEEVEKNLIASAVTEAKFKFRQDRELLIPVADEERADLLDEWFPHQRTGLVVEAVMVPLQEGLDFTEEEVETFLSQTFSEPEDPSPSEQ